MNRDDRFLRTFRELIWNRPSSPYVRLLRHAGVEAGDVARLVRQLGLEGCMNTLRDEGVYVAYEEWLGSEPARRGSATFFFNPLDFLNDVVRGDFLVSTGGTRSFGIPVNWSFAYMRRSLARHLLSASSWGVAGTPAAMWLPTLPSGMGLTTALVSAACGEPPERWFTQVPLRLSGIGWRTRVAKSLLPAMALLGARIPHPEYVPPSDPQRVLEWVRDALVRSGKARLCAYTTCAVLLAEAAKTFGISLDGLLIGTVGEPLGERRADIIRGAGAVVCNGYGFMEKGTVGLACPSCGAEEFHLLESEVCVVQRLRPRKDEVVVPAFLWTSVDRDSPSVLFNTENDDYGELERPGPACSCELGLIGMRTRVSGVRGISKINVAGTSLPGEALSRIAEEILPSRFGGTPGSYQFVKEDSDDVPRMELRIAPSVGSISDDVVRRVIAEELSKSNRGILANALWSTAEALPISRADPLLTQSGKWYPVSLSPQTRPGGDDVRS